MNNAQKKAIFGASVPLVGGLLSRMLGGIADRVKFRREMREERQERAATAERCRACLELLTLPQCMNNGCDEFDTQKSAARWKKQYTENGPKSFEKLPEPPEPFSDFTVTTAGVYVFISLGRTLCLNDGQRADLSAYVARRIGTGPKTPNTTEGRELHWAIIRSATLSWVREVYDKLPLEAPAKPSPVDPRVSEVAAVLEKVGANSGVRGNTLPRECGNCLMVPCGGCTIGAKTMSEAKKPSPERCRDCFGDGEFDNCPDCPLHQNRERGA